MSKENPSSFGVTCMRILTLSINGLRNIFTNDTLHQLTEEECIASAKKFKTRKDWFANDRDAYLAARDLMCLKLCTLHMNSTQKSRTKDDCVASAKNYKSVLEWKISEPINYFFAQKRGYLNECCQHMPKKEALTYEQCRSAAEEHNAINSDCFRHYRALPSRLALLEA